MRDLLSSQIQSDSFGLINNVCDWPHVHWALHSLTLRTIGVCTIEKHWLNSNTNEQKKNAIWNSGSKWINMTWHRHGIFSYLCAQSNTHFWLDLETFDFIFFFRLIIFSRRSEGLFIKTTIHTTNVHVLKLIFRN